MTTCALVYQAIKVTDLHTMKPSVLYVDASEEPVAEPATEAATEPVSEPLVESVEELAAELEAQVTAPGCEQHHMHIHYSTALTELHNRISCALCRACCS